MTLLQSDLEPVEAQLEGLRLAVNEVRDRIARRHAAVRTASTVAASIPNAPDDLVGLARKAAAIYAGRRARSKIFGELDVFGEPAWDLMLDLFVNQVENRPIAVSSAVIASAVAPTTALRWITTLIQEGLLERVPDQFDRRRAFVRLTGKGMDLTGDAIARA